MRYLILLSLFIVNVSYGQEISKKIPFTLFNKLNSNKLIVYLSGDGGMNTFSQNVCTELANKGYAVLAVDSKKYFWEQKKPQLFAAELALLIDENLTNLKANNFSLVGYSFGADCAAFLANRLDPKTSKGMQKIILLSPSESTDFVIKIADMLGIGSKEATYKTLPEIVKIQHPVLLLIGSEENTKFIQSIPEKSNLKKLFLPGSHKFNNDTKKVTQEILNFLN